jgi:hypothetical protein
MRPPIELQAGATRLVFRWHADRWSHALAPAPVSGQESAAHAEWASLDGAWPADGDPRWPASPVLVELSRLPGHGAAATIVGVGMAGRSHYSASVGRDPLVADAVRFEIACRLHDGPGWLGSTYRVIDGQGPRLVRIEAACSSGPLPRTVEWSYSIGPQGIFGLRGATEATARA